MFNADTHTRHQLLVEKMRVDQLIGVDRAAILEVKRHAAITGEFAPKQVLKAMEESAFAKGIESQALQIEIVRAKEMGASTFDKVFIKVCQEMLTVDVLNTIVSETNQRIKKG